MIHGGHFVSESHHKSGGNEEEGDRASSDVQPTLQLPLSCRPLIIQRWEKVAAMFAAFICAGYC